jgi:hypothetical protein
MINLVLKDGLLILFVYSDGTSTVLITKYTHCLLKTSDIHMYVLAAVF